MRYIDPELKNRIQKAQQTLYENAEPSIQAWIARPHPSLLSPLFLERTTEIGGLSSVSSVAITMRRPLINRAADRIYIAVRDGTVGKVFYSTQTADISQHMWYLLQTIPNVQDITICFDGIMKKNIRQRIEFVTVGAMPYVIWTTSSGEMYAQVVGDDTTRVILATENVSAVAAVRGYKSELAGLDQGLIVFFLLAGSLYFRTLISGVWEDGQPVNFGPSGTWVDLAANRTWDYRLVVQMQDSSGRVVELITRTEGIAKQNTEHIELTNIRTDANRIGVTYRDTDDAEHIELGDISVSAALPWGATTNSVTRIANVNNGSGDWGRFIEIEVEYPWYSLPAIVLEDVNTSQIIPQEGMILTDGVLSIEISHTLEFGINAVLGDIRTTISGGTNEAGIVYDQMVTTFTPTNLVPPIMNPPELEDLWNE